MNNVFDKVWLRVAIIVAVVTTAFAGTVWANEPITVELEGFTTTEGQIDGNISFSTTGGSASDSKLTATTFTLTAANNAKINSVSFRYASWAAVITWNATNIEATGSFEANEGGNEQLKYPEVTGLNCEKIVFNAPSEWNKIIIDYISVTYTPGTPDSGKSIIALSSDTNKGTVTLNGNVVVATPKSGYAVDDETPYRLTEGSAVVTPYGSKYFAVKPSPDCTIVINFVAHAGSVSLDFEHSSNTEWSCQDFERVTSTNPYPHGGAHMGKSTGNSASIQTTAKIGYPGTFSCYVCPVVSITWGTTATWKVEVSSDGSIWRDVDNNTIELDNYSTQGKWVQLIVDLSSETDVYVRLSYTGAQAGVDDIVLTTRPAPVLSTIPVTISSVGYSTLYYGTLNLVVPEGVTASTYSYDGTSIAVSKTYVAGKVIPAGTGVVLQGGQGTYDFVVTTEAGEADANNALRGTDEAALTTGGVVYYALSTKNGSNIGFYWMRNDGAAFTNSAHKAYLAISGSEVEVKGFAIGLEDDATAIETIVNGQQTTEGAIYNLAGQRINKMQKGINIVNGKKIAIK